MYKVAHYSLYSFFFLIKLSDCVVVIQCDYLPLSPYPHVSRILPVPLSSMITALPRASEFELGLPVIPPHVIVIIYKFVSVHVKYRMFYYKLCVTVGEGGKVLILNMLLVQSD